MEGPQPPRDANLRNIIDKLAEFVARNGPDFESITKEKQRGNPKFQFLYGGEYVGYYRYRVAAEQTFLKQQGSMPQGTSGSNTAAVGTAGAGTAGTTQQPQMHFMQQQQQQMMNAINLHDTGCGVGDGISAAQSQYSLMQQPPPPHLWAGQQGNMNAPPPQTNTSANITMNLTAQIEAINIQQNVLREQIRQSETNLSAQNSVLLVQQNKQIDEAIEEAQTQQLDNKAEELGIPLKEFDVILQPIIESCTKDSISSGKNWILQHSSDSAKNNVVLQYLLKKALANGSTFLQKLHLIYLVNDILHHCLRKNVDDLKNCLENVVIPMFCSAELIATDDQRGKLTKLLQLWESKAKFFDACVISKLQSPDSSMKEHKNNMINQHPEIVAKFTQIRKATMDKYQKQHQIFIQHATQQITQLETQKQHLEQQMFSAVLPNANTVLSSPTPQLNTVMQQQQSSAQLTTMVQQQQQHHPTQNSLSIPSLMSQKITPPIETDVAHQILHHNAATTVAANLLIDNNILMNNNNNNNNSNNNSCINYANGNNNNNNNNNIFNNNKSNNNNNNNMQRFIPDLSKPPPGFANPVNINVSIQQHQHQQQQQQQQQHVQMHHNMNENMSGYAQMSNVNMQQQQQQQQQPTNHMIPDNMSIGNLNVAAVAAMQLAQQQQQQQQQFQQHQQQLLSIPQQVPSQPLMPPPTLQYPHLQQQQTPPSQQQQLLMPALNENDPLKIPMQNEDLPATAPEMDMSQGARPTVPYYDLPAGLMVPLIRLEDCHYKPLDPEDIRIPPPQLQSNRLTMALAAFYAPPTHDGPRDTDGWEKLGLYEYYKVKNAARKQKEDDIRQGVREKSRSPTPVLMQQSKRKKFTKKRRYRSKSPSPVRQRSISRSRSKSNSPRSKSKSPIARSRTSSPGRGRNSRNSRYSRGRTSRSPQYRERERDRDRESNASNSSNGSRESREHRNDRSTRRDRERSTTPPSFFGNSFTRSSDFIEETNKGHQMLMKMGWTGAGTGLGTNNQGIDQPIPSGDVRDRKDLYKGVGVNLNDPFENFRKNKGAAFVHRMRTRDEKS